MDDRLWREAAAGVQSDLDAQIREEAREVFVAEAARSRLVERRGRVRVVLRCGQVIGGVLEEGALGDAGLLTIRDQAGDRLLVPSASVLVVTGSRPGLRDEGASGPTLAAILREAWATGSAVRALLADGRWAGGVVAFVGADHVDLSGDAGPMTVPFTAVDAWNLGGRT